MHDYSQLAFKVMAERHMVQVHTQPVQMKVNVATNVAEFVPTTAR